VTRDVAEAVLPTPLGVRLYICCDERGVIASRWTSRRQARAPASRNAAARLARDVARQCNEYFARRRGRFDVPLVLEGTPLECAAWHAVSALHVGMLVSYAEVARAIGRPGAHRAVAHAMARSPFDLFIPAHRVIGADGRIKGAGPRSMRRRLLAFEGISVR